MLRTNQATFLPSLVPIKPMVCAN